MITPHSTYLVAVEVCHLAVNTSRPAERHSLDAPVGGRVEELRAGRGGGAGDHQPVLPRPLALRGGTAELQPEVPLEPGIVDVTCSETNINLISSPPLWRITLPTTEKVTGKSWTQMGNTYLECNRIE